MPVGIVAFSFALRGKGGEPNPCNKRLGTAVDILQEKYPANFTVAQWEIDLFLQRLGTHVDIAVQPHQNGDYLDSEDIWHPARELFRQNGVTHVIVVAQPFLHRFLCRRMVQADGFKIIKSKIGWIGFDNDRARFNPKVAIKQHLF